jgi:hypothetical protein
VAASSETVCDALDTDSGRACWWAESAVERDGAVDRVFPGVARWRGPILARERPAGSR